MLSPISRREWLSQTGCGFGAVALAGLSAQSSVAKVAAVSNPLAARAPNHAPKAKRVIFLFMQGGVSHVDTYDYKPRLLKDDGKAMPFDDARAIANTGTRGSSQKVMKPLWKFAQHGKTGRWASDLLPEVNAHLDELCFVHSMHTEGVAHGPATLFLHCGSTNFVRPSMGSWVLYGLGSENANLPGFLSIAPSPGNGGPRNYGPAFLPAVYQGTALGKAGTADATIRNLTGTLPPAAQQARFELLREMHAEQLKRRPGDAELEAVAASFELGWRMQQNAPDAMDLSKESAETLKLYGIGEKATDTYGRQCLTARRMAEAGVRYIQVTYGDASANPAWDQHSNMPKHADHAKAVDKPIAGLLADLKRRGLLEDTLVWWGGEFGRTPYAQGNGTGRDHNPGGFTQWLAGAGVKRGFAYGATDEFGAKAVENKVHMHDLHATILHLLGLDHEKLTYRYAGRDFRLTDVHGHVVTDIIA
ncbi:MAG: DUF1501 domain-containing protein [Fimbriiglobus sp.]